MRAQTGWPIGVRSDGCVRDSSLRQIWFDSEGFNHYRGTGWMKKPCRDCEHKEEDLGGCRCQAYLLAGDAYATDPVCPQSPHHEIVSTALENAAKPARQAQPLVFRDPKESQRLAQVSAIPTHRPIRPLA